MIIQHSVITNNHDNNTTISIHPLQLPSHPNQ